MNKIVSALFIVAGGIHLLPLSGLLGAKQLTRAYGLDFSEPNLAILMRHRALLLGLLGALLVMAGFIPGLQSLALAGGFASVASFLWLAWTVGGYNALLARVVIADAVALGCLLVATLLRMLT